jgi:hypothetical protein
MFCFCEVNIRTPSHAQHTHPPTLIRAQATRTHTNDAPVQAALSSLQQQHAAHNAHSQTDTHVTRQRAYTTHAIQSHNTTRTSTGSNARIALVIGNTFSSSSTTRHVEHLRDRDHALASPLSRTHLVKDNMNLSLNRPDT